MAGVQTEKLALQMTVNFQGQLARLAGWHPQPVHYTSMHQSTLDTHTFTKTLAQYYMHILYTVALYLNSL